MTDQETALPLLFPPFYKLFFLNQIPAVQRRFMNCAVTNKQTFHLQHRVRSGEKHTKPDLNPWTHFIMDICLVSDGEPALLPGFVSYFPVCCTKWGKISFKPCNSPQCYGDNYLQSYLITKYLFIFIPLFKYSQANEHLMRIHICSNHLHRIRSQNKVNFKSDFW